MVLLIAILGFSFSKAQKVGETITGQYVYYDAEGDPEGESMFQWYRDGVAIPGANSINYTITQEDIGKTLIFEVVPVALTGISPGEPIRSSGILVTGTDSTTSSQNWLYNFTKCNRYTWSNLFVPIGWHCKYLRTI